MVASREHKIAVMTRGQVVTLTSQVGGVGGLPLGLFILEQQGTAFSRLLFKAQPGDSPDSLLELPIASGSPREYAQPEPIQLAYATTLASEEVVADTGIEVTPDATLLMRVRVKARRTDLSQAQAWELSAIVARNGASNPSVSGDIMVSVLHGTLPWTAVLDVALVSGQWKVVVRVRGAGFPCQWYLSTTYF